MTRWRVLALAAMVAIAAWFGIDVRGWTRIPADAPLQSRVLQPAYTQAARAADALLRDAQKELGVVGLSGAVSIDGELVWAAAAGWADLESHRSMTPDAIFRIGSTSKALTATLLARLVDEHVIDLDAPISRYMKVPNPQWAALTARQLASHTAGLPGYEENRDVWGLYQSVVLHRRYDDVADSLEIFDDTDLLYPPGAAFHYSSFDVNLLSAVMQSAAHQPYLELLQQRVLDPLRMLSTSGDGHAAQADRIATFYELRAAKAKPWRRVDLTQKLASGGLLSTSADLTRLCGGWFDAGFIQPQTVQTFWEPQRLHSGALNEQGYALGWRAKKDSKALADLGETERYHHGGVSKGAMSWLVCYPEYKLGVALNINSLLDNFDALADREPAISRIFAAALVRGGQ